MTILIDPEKLILTEEQQTNEIKTIFEKNPYMPTEALLKPLVWSASVSTAKSILSHPLLLEYIEQQRKEARKEEREQIGIILEKIYVEAGISFDLAEAISQLQGGEALKEV